MEKVLSMSHKGWDLFCEQHRETDKFHIVDVETLGFPEDLASLLRTKREAAEIGVSLPETLDFYQAGIWIRENKGKATTRGRLPNQILGTLMKQWMGRIIPNTVEIKKLIVQWAKTSEQVAKAIQEAKDALALGATRIVVLGWLGESNGNDLDYGYRWAVVELIRNAVDSQLSFDFDFRDMEQPGPSEISADARSKQSQAHRLDQEAVPLFPTEDELYGLDTEDGEAPPWIKDAERDFGERYFTACAIRATVLG